MNKKQKNLLKTKAFLMLFIALNCVLWIAANSRHVSAADEAFERQKATDLHSQGKFTVTGDGISLKEKEKADGLMISAADAAAYGDAVFTFENSFDFGAIPAEYLVIDALAERKKNIELALYLDDAKEAFATVKLARQKKDEIWSTVKTRTVKFPRLTGKHKLHFKVVTPETGKLKLVLRSALFLKNDIPMVEFDLDETQGSIDAMNGDFEHNTECYGNMTVVIPEGYKSEYSNKECKTETYALDYIRGRGNSTWMANKKPYKIKLDKKQNLLGMGQNKHWVLLANYYDISMLRNKITYWLGRELGMEFTPKCEFVNVIMNGEYLGSYYLCEHIRLGENRVDIDDLEKDDATMHATDPETISGGYLLSMYPAGDEEGQQIVTSRDMRLLIESPSFEDYLNETQLNYIRDYVQKTEDAIYGENFRDESGKSYKEYMDVAAAVDYYWIQEISMNGDGFGSGSTYLYKKRNGKLYWGPLWDFDYVAWGATEYMGNNVSGYYHNGSTWFGQLFQDPEFYQAVTDRWPAIKEKLLEASKDGGQIDIYSKKQYESQKHNYEIWEQYSEGEFWDEGEADNTDTTNKVTYDSEVERFKRWIRERIDWIDENLSSLRKTYYQIKFMIDDETFTTLSVEENERVWDIPEAPGRDGYAFDGWYIANEDGTLSEEFTSLSPVSSNLAVKAKYSDLSKIPAVQQVCFAKDEIYMLCEDEISIQYCVLPFEAYAGNLTWSSSDENIVTIPQSGRMLSYARSGDVVITVTAPNGTKGSFTVHVLDSRSYDFNSIRSCSPAQKEYTVKAGEYKRIDMIMEPTQAVYYGDMRFVSSDENIVKVNDCGYIYGFHPGEAVVTCDPINDSMKTIKITVTASDASVPEAGTTFTAKGLKYKILATGENRTAVCTGAKDKKRKTVTIPATVKYKNKTYKVTEIGKKAFANCKKLKKAVIGKNVAKISKSAFANRKKLNIVDKRFQ